MFWVLLESLYIEIDYFTTLKTRRIGGCSRLRVYVQDVLAFQGILAENPRFEGSKSGPCSSRVVDAEGKLTAGIHCSGPGTNLGC